MIRVRIKNDRGYSWWKVGDIGYVIHGKSLDDWERFGRIDVKHSEHDGMASFERNDIDEEPLATEER